MGVAATSAATERMHDAREVESFMLSDEEREVKEPTRTGMAVVRHVIGRFHCDVYSPCSKNLRRWGRENKKEEGNE